MLYVIELPDILAVPPQPFTGVETKCNPAGRVSVKSTVWDRLPGTLVMVKVIVAGVPTGTVVGLKAFVSVGDNTCTFATADIEFPVPE